ncbi:penicillin-binding protein 1B [Sideroxydans lithotrophicus]|uniref:Penicillin-binding protein 1B n=1 Tax=Sideroxydans lithotrophicus (strain ES-1) TaxID=580332 RepID=D5CR79_SIDLE|nr:penicillin-binding protein 1B [Sideroxydans lithotrophicus]ADE11465.1 penicillin-binding protein 1B [Sideroxydans lithotrophicus ES-1]
MKLPSLPWNKLPSGLSFKSRGRAVRLIVLLLMLGLSGYIYYLDVTIREAFEGRKFALPARVYGRALEVYPGLKLTSVQFGEELKRLGYHERPEPNEAATYRYTLNGYEFTTRDFVFGDGPQASQHVRIEFTDGKVSLLQLRGNPDADLPLLRMEPPLIGGIYPGHNEDRELLRLSQVPKPLIDALVATEDRKFYTHWGIDPRGIARALFKTVTGQRIEGGSTLTQQLVKNFFLTSERTLTRKGTEVLMALLLEMHYSKDEILETYINEIFLGQDSSRAIHGFGLASYFYFDRPLDRLELQEMATLVGMVKGPSVYDPRKHPQLTLQRRNVVLQEMVSQNVITQAQFVAAKQKPLGVVQRAPAGTSPYPAFLQYVHRQLERDYREEDLRSEGLRIFTTLDPNIQQQAEQALASRLGQIEKSRKFGANTLEGAVVVSSTQTGEIQAMVGGRDARYAGYNRAIDAQRQIGSLAKPIVYLTALAMPDRYTLITPLDDSPLVWSQPGTTDWKPQNYDRQFHGQVQLRTALAHSYNVATARLGIGLGVDTILDKLPLFGIEKRPPPFASSLLGAFELSPVEVAQLYQTFADNGFRTPLRGIREVVTADGKPLQHYPINVEPVAAAGPVYLLTAAMQGVVREGTAQSMINWLPADLNVAGKTGTTEDLHDSWFAGYTGDHVAVVWVGRDDNQSSGLTGASGAMTVWGEMMKNIQPEPLQPVMPDDIEMVNVDPATGVRYDDDCRTGVLLPFIKGSAPAEKGVCAFAPAAVQLGDRPTAKVEVKPEVKQEPEKKNWLERLFN